MKIKVIREMDAGYDRRELLMEVDDEVLAVYMTAMNVEEFDQDSLKINQRAYKTYDISLKIREVW